MSETDRSRSESPASDHQSERKSRNSRDSGSNRSSYSEKFYSDDGFSEKNESKRKTQNGIPRNNKGSFQRSRAADLIPSNHRIGSHWGGGEGTVASRRVISANRIKVNDLRNKISELSGQLIELQQENRDIKRQLHQRERRLGKYEQQENDMPTLLQRQSHEAHAFREQLRRQKKRLEEKEKKLKNTQEELQRNQKLLKKMKELVDDKQLAERDELNTKLYRAETDLKEKESSLKKLEDYVENLKKNHKHELGIERARSKDAQRNLTELQVELDRMRSVLKDKERELGVSNIRPNRQTKPPLRTSGGASASPAGDSQINHSRPVKYQDVGPNRKNSLGSMDSAADERKSQAKKTTFKDDSSKEIDREWDLEKRRQLDREREMERRLELERHRAFEKEMEREREHIKELEKERELLKEIEKERGLAKSMEKERGLLKEVDRERDTVELKKVKELDAGNKVLQKLEHDNDRKSEKHDKKFGYGEESRMKLEKDLQERERKEREEKERHARELEADREAHSFENEEQMKQKAILLAKMRAIDEQKLVNDKEFFLTTPSHNEFIQREKQMVANGNKNVLSFGDYKPSFLSENGSSKSSKMGFGTGNDTKTKTNKPNGDVFGSDSLMGLNASSRNGQEHRFGLNVSKAEHQTRKVTGLGRKNLDEDVEEVLL